MLLKRVEFLGDREGRAYQIDTEDETVIIEKEPMEGKSVLEKERILDKELDAFSDGYNRLEEIDGVLYEVHHCYFCKIMQKAYLV